MTRMGALTTALAAAAPAAVPSVAQDFYAYWGDGLAEVSSYRVVQPRYGEARAGYGVLVFVTEDVNRHTFVKVESPAPAAPTGNLELDGDLSPAEGVSLRETQPGSGLAGDRIYALKLNSVLKFTTGIYDYSVMTSVFSAVEPRAGEEGAFELLKVNLTSQEWCGHVFEEVQVRDGAILGDLNSYFEAEGRRQWRFEKPRPFASEDHLLVQIRELKGPVMAEGETRALTLLPSLWQFRVTHRPRQLVPATLHKGQVAPVDAGGSSRLAVPWTWSYGDREQTVWVEADYPHRILRWESADGGLGELVASRRLPYWTLHDLDDEPLRDELGIPR